LEIEYAAAQSRPVQAERWTTNPRSHESPEGGCRSDIDPPRVRAMELVDHAVGAQKDGRLDEALRKCGEGLVIYHTPEVAEHAEQLEKSFQSRK
jgi:hypothetical protein